MFVSYAQNFEDVLLWRALGHIEGGFYIDLGAQEPDLFSVSRAFYEHGWRGVHVEPVPHYAERLRAARPDEDVIEAAISTREGAIGFYAIADTGLSTGRAEIAERHSQAGFPVERTEVAALRLGALLDRYRDRDIHWLKIDVEEMEAEVIASWSPSAVRPWVVLVESTAPLSQEPSFAEWEPMLLAMNYRFAHFDGLNRYYVHAGRPELAERLQLGPNVFDGFVVGEGSPYARLLEDRVAEAAEELGKARGAAAEERASLVAAMRQDRATLVSEGLLKDEQIRTSVAELKLLRSQLAAMADQAVRQEKVLRQGSSRMAEQQIMLDAMHASNSWRVTAPFRSIKRFGLRVRGVDFPALLRSVIVRSARLVLRVPLIAFHGRRQLRKFPRAEAWLRHMLHSGSRDHAAETRSSSSAEDMPPRTLRLYRTIAAARSRGDAA